MKNFIYLIAFLLVSKFSFANNIDGAFGLKIGDYFSNKTSSQVIKFKPQNPLPGVSNYSVKLTPISNRIYEIRAEDDVDSCNIRYDLDTILESKYGKPAIYESGSVYSSGVYGKENIIVLACFSFSTHNSFSINYASPEMRKINKEEIEKLRLEKFKLRIEKLKSIDL